MIIRNFMLQIFFFASILAFVYTSERKPSFIATFPSSVISGVNAQFCIRFQNLHESDISFKISDNEPHVFEEINRVIPFENTDETCIAIPIYDTNKILYNKKISVHGMTADSQYTFNDTRYFQIIKKSDLNLIETDKPVYKPGQKVRIRILSLSYDLKPVPKIFKTVFIVDSSNSRVSQWLGVNSEKGLVELEMPLSEEPNLGMWKIIVEEDGDNKRHQTVKFEVKKYVLPKFEVKIHNYKRVRFDDSSMEVEVCGKYSYGKDVIGQSTLKAFTKEFSYRSGKELVFKEIELTSPENVKGCHTFNVNLKELGIGGPKYLYNAYFEASVKESDTDIVANATSSVTMAYESMKLEVDDVSYYKPGFPVNIRVTVKNIRDELLEGEKIEISLAKNDLEFFKITSVSDKNGYINVVFDPNECELCAQSEERNKYNRKPTSLKLIVKPVNFDVDSSLPHYRQIHSPQIIRYISPWISQNDSYIQILRDNNIPDQLNFGDTAKLAVKLRTHSELTENDLIHFQFQSRANVINSGHFNIHTNGQVASRILTKVSLSKKDQLDLEVISKEEPNLVKKECLKKRTLMNTSEPLTYDSWEYNPETNECELYLIHTSKAPLHYIKESCEAECQIPNVLYNIAGKPTATLDSNKSIYYEYTFDMEFEVTSEMSPNLRILVFSIDNTEIIPDHMSLKVNMGLENKVNIILNKKRVSVNSNTKLTVKTEPHSLCAISAIDKSVTFMGKRNAIKLDEILNKLTKYEASPDYQNNYKTPNQCNYDIFPIRIPNRPMPIPMPEMPIPEMPIPEMTVAEAEPIVVDDEANSRKKRSSFFPWFGSSSYDANKAFKDSRLLYLSDLKVHMECEQIRPHEIAFFEAPPVMMEADQSNVGSEPAKAIQQTIRTFFPETWIWDIQVSDENGLIQKTQKSPDTITDWVIDAYCLSDTAGLGIGETKSLKVFQSIFTSMTLPYSVIKGETFPIKASVFNYAKTCLPIQIDLLSDKRFKIPRESTLPGSAKYCICPDEKITHEFNLKAMSMDMDNGLRVAIRVSSIEEPEICENLGKRIRRLFRFRDIEKKNVLVEPEGIPKEHVKSQFVIFKSEQSLVNQSLEVSLPSNTVPGSVRAYLSTTGDAMGSVLNNLDKLVRQPTGCGEQNMVKFAPIVSVVNYLKETDQMTDEMDQKTKKFLKIGYQRQLTYRHKDGSFSAFGPNNYRKETGGTWLTAFVLRCFSDSYASKQIEIDQNDLLLSSKLLLKRQDEDGSFRQEGAKLFSSALAGGLKKNKKAGLSAYVLISLLKTAKNFERILVEHKSQLENALNYLRDSASDLENTDTYTLALSLYAFRLYDSTDEFVSKLESELDSRSIQSNGLIHWSETADDKSVSSKSADLEITAYILISKLNDAFDRKKTNELISISKWINSQRNSFGGFYSTQDTVVALEALSKFASAFYSKDISLKTSYYLSEDLNSEKMFSIDNTNRLLVQKIKLNDFVETGMNKISFDIHGYGTALMQLIVKYNVMEEVEKEDDNDFEFGIFSMKSDLGSRCDYASLSVDTRYTGKQSKSGMALVSIKLPSGWNAIEETVNALKSSIDVKRYEINENIVILYFDEIEKEGILFSFDVKKEFEIKDRKPGLISVYDYYESFDQTITHPFEIDDTCDDE